MRKDYDVELGLMRVEIDQVHIELERIHRYHQRKFWFTLGILSAALGIPYLGGLIW